jgi:hypothetical protein
VTKYIKDLKLHIFVNLTLVQFYCHTKKKDSGPPLMSLGLSLGLGIEFEFEFEFGFGSDIETH